MQNRPALAILNEDYPKVKNTTANDLSDLINYLINILNIQRPSNEDTVREMNQQMLLVGDLIRTKFGYLTIPEIKEAFKMYVSREFPQIKVFRLLDCVSIGDVLFAYTEFRSESLKIYSEKKQALLNALIMPSDEDKKQIREQFLKVVFDELVSEGFCQDAFQLFFDLEMSGKIKPTIDEKKALYAKELKKYIPAEKEEIKSKGGLSAKSLLADFQKRIDSGKPLTYVQNRCRSIMACEYLKNHLTDFETFKKAIENEKQL